MLCCFMKWSGLRTISEEFLKKKGVWHQKSQKYCYSVEIPGLKRATSISFCSIELAEANWLQLYVLHKKESSVSNKLCNWHRSQTERQALNKIFVLLISNLWYSYLCKKNPQNSKQIQTLKNLQLSQVVILLSEEISPFLCLLLLQLIFGDLNVTSLCL